MNRSAVFVTLFLGVLAGCGSMVADTQELYSIDFTTFDDRLPDDLRDIAQVCTNPLALRPDTAVDPFGSCRDGGELDALLLRPLQERNFDAWLAVLLVDAELQDPSVMPRTLHVDSGWDWLSFLEVDGFELGCDASWSSRTDFMGLDLVVEDVYWADPEDEGSPPRLRVELSAPKTQWIAQGSFTARLDTCGVCTDLPLIGRECFDVAPSDWVGVDGVDNAHWEAGLTGLVGTVDLRFELQKGEIVVVPDISVSASDIVFALTDLPDPWEAGSVARLGGAGTVADLSAIATELIRPQVETLLVPELAELVRSAVPEGNELCWLGAEPGLVIASDEPGTDTCLMQP